MPSQSIHTRSPRLDLVPSPSVRAALMCVALVIVAAFVGLAIAKENWLFALAPLGLLLLVAWPVEFALGVYVFMLPLEPLTATDKGAGPSTTALWYAGIIVIFVMFTVGYLRNRLVRPPTPAILFSSVIMLAAVSTLWAIDPARASGRLVTALGLWALYIVLTCVRITKRELSRIITAAIAGGTAAAIVSTYTFFQGGFSGRASLMEGTTEADPNFFAVALLLPLSLAVGEALSDRRWVEKSGYLMATGVMALGIILSMSRGALAGLAAITFVFLLRFRLNWRTLLPVVAIAIAMMYAPPLFFERVQDASSSRISGRQDIWEAGVQSLRSYAVIGAGLENFANAYDEYAGKATHFAGHHRDAHNIYISTCVELGVGGLLLLLAAFRKSLRLLRQGHSIIPRQIALEAACWGMLIAGLTLDILWRKSFWFAWALPILWLHSQREPEGDTLNSSNPSSSELFRSARV